MEGMDIRLDEMIIKLDEMIREGIFALTTDRFMGMLQYIKQGE